MSEEIENIIDTINEYLGKLINAIKESAELFQRYEESQGTALLCEIIDGVEWAMDALVGINRLEENKIQEINRKLGEITTALENSDYILVGDLLQYEFLPEVEGFQESLSSFGK